MKKLLFVVAVVSLVFGAVLGCAPTSVPSQSSASQPTSNPAAAQPTSSPAGAQQAALPEKTVNVGVVTYLTGPAAVWGLAHYHGVELALEDANNAGGIVIDGIRYKFKVIAEDDKGQPNLSMDATNKLVLQDGVIAVSGPQNAAGNAAAAPFLAKNKIINLSASYTDSILDNEWTYRITIPPALKAPAFYEWILKNNPSIKSAAGLAPNNQTGWNQSKYEMGYLESLDVKVSDRLFFDDTTDFLPFLTKMLANNPGLINLGGTPSGSTALIAKQARGLGFKGIIANISPTGADDMVPVVGKDVLEGLVTSSLAIEPPMISPKILDLANRERAKYGQAYSATWDFYTYGDILAQAVRKAGSVDPSKIKAVLDDTKQTWDYPVISGAKLKFGDTTSMKVLGANGVRQASYPFVVTVIKDGKNGNVANIVP